MGGREQKEHFPFGSILEERIVRLGLIHQPVSVILPRFENSRNVEMRADLLIEKRLRDWLKRHGRNGRGSLWLFVALEDTVI